MKNIPVVVLVVFGFVTSVVAEAATPQKRTRSQARIGPYATGVVGMASYGADQADAEDFASRILSNNGVPYQNLEVSTDDTDLGFQAAFGYRFSRYGSVEFSLHQLGELSSSSTAELDFPDDGAGFLPASSELTFDGGGIGFSLIGILPINNSFEIFGRLGYLFANVDRRFAGRVDGDLAIQGGGQDDTQVPYYGLGLGWNINQVFTIRAEYQIIRDIGNNFGGEDIDILALGLGMRF